jgi:hypothetical protein
MIYSLLHLLHSIFMCWAIQDHNWSTEAKIAHKLLHGEDYESFN